VYGSIVLNPDWSIMAFLVNSGKIYFKRVSDDEFLGAVLGKGQIFVLSMAFSPDGSILAAGTKHSSVRLWAVSDAVLQ